MLDVGSFTKIEGHHHFEMTVNRTQYPSTIPSEDQPIINFIIRFCMSFIIMGINNFTKYV